MLIFTNCLADIVDEGCLKIANSLVKRLKKADNKIKAVSFERKSNLTNYYLKTNKFLISKDTVKFFCKTNDKILYIPFPAKAFSSAVRICVLSLLSRRKINVLFTQITEIGFWAKLLLKISKARFWVLSEKTQEKLSSFLNESRVLRLKTGVDTEKFIPVNYSEANRLKIKYGLMPDKPVILHAGHMKKGRNIAEMLKIKSDYQILLLTSTLTKNEEDAELKSLLSERKNIRIIDEYVPEVEEIFQLSDLYFFPVIEEGNCIDIPLSCLEAAACNKPIITTDFGGMKDFKGKNGFGFIDSFEENKINELIDEALRNKAVDTRSSVVDYDWNKAVDYLISSI